MGHVTVLKSTILSSRNLTFFFLIIYLEQIQHVAFLSSLSQLSTAGDGKDVPFNSWAGTKSSQSHIYNRRLL